MLSILAAIAALSPISVIILPSAYAQTSTQTFDMTPLVSVIIAIIPAFIVIALLDKLLGKFR